jgi:hypothetical protein
MADHYLGAIPVGAWLFCLSGMILYLAVIRRRAVKSVSPVREGMSFAVQPSLDVKSKRWLALITSLFIVALLGWSVYRQAAPRWVISSHNQYFGTCRAAAQLEAYDARPVEDSKIATITPMQARAIAYSVIARYYDFSPTFLSDMFLSYGPRLVQGTFPDGKQRLAWYQVVIVDDGGSTLLGEAAVVYLDALTGRPLILITGAVVGDPWMVCGG